MMVLYVGHFLYDDYTLERIYDVLYVYEVHYTLPERITYNRIMHLCFIVHNGQNLLQCYNPGKKFKMAITRLYIAKSGILRRDSIRMHKGSPRNMLQI